MKITYPEDIIEYALQFGIKRTCEYYTISKDEVVVVLKPFTDEIDLVLSPFLCKQDPDKHAATICEFCTYRPRSFRF